MKLEQFAGSVFGRLLVRALGAVMESRFRYRFFGPAAILRGVDGLEGKCVLEVGCGTGFFTLPAAGMIGDHGSLVAMDLIPASVQLVSKKVQAAAALNVRVTRGDARETKLDAESFDLVLLFGVIPAPMLPLEVLLPEMHRVLRPAGTLAVWPPVPGWLPQSIARSGLFTCESSRNGVYNFRRCEMAGVSI